MLRDANKMFRLKLVWVQKVSISNLVKLLYAGTTTCLKNCANLFLSELCQFSTNFDNFWQNDGKAAKIM